MLLLRAWRLGEGSPLLAPNSDPKVESVHGLGAAHDAGSCVADRPDFNSKVFSLNRDGLCFCPLRCRVVFEVADSRKVCPATASFSKRTEVSTLLHLFMDCFKKETYR